MFFHRILSQMLPVKLAIVSQWLSLSFASRTLKKKKSDSVAASSRGKEFKFYII